MPEDPKEKTETAREDLALIVIALVCSMLSAGIVGATVWNDLDKLFAVIGLTAIWGAFGAGVYAIKSELW